MCCIHICVLVGFFEVGFSVKPIASATFIQILVHSFVPKPKWHSVTLVYIYIYAFSRRFYPKRITLHSSYSFTFYQLFSIWFWGLLFLCSSRLFVYIYFGSLFLLECWLGFTNLKKTKKQKKKTQDQYLRACHCVMWLTGLTVNLDPGLV